MRFPQKGTAKRRNVTEKIICLCPGLCLMMNDLSSLFLICLHTIETDWLVRTDWISSFNMTATESPNNFLGGNEKCCFLTCTGLNEKRLPFRHVIPKSVVNWDTFFTLVAEPSRVFWLYTGVSKVMGHRILNYMEKCKDRRSLKSMCFWLLQCYVLYL
jgi:hypothetical protein